MTVYYVGDETDLDNAIAGINAGTVATVDFLSDITLTADIPVIDGNAVINGDGFTINGGYLDRGLMVLGGSVAVNHLQISDAAAFGGTGGYGVLGGGGGAGLGGGLFVGAEASVTLSNVGFYKDLAVGGAGGSNNRSLSTTANNMIGAGGGGGMGGWGGNGGYSDSAGGGGGLGSGAYGQSGLRDGGYAKNPLGSGGWKQDLTDASFAKSVFDLARAYFAEEISDFVFAGSFLAAFTFTQFVVRAIGELLSKPVGLGGGPGAGIDGLATGNSGNGGGVQSVLPSWLSYISLVWFNSYPGGTGAAKGGGGGAGWSAAGGGGGAFYATSGQDYSPSTPLAGGNGGFGGGGGGGVGGFSGVTGNGSGGAGGFGGGGGGGFGGGAGGFGGGGGGYSGRGGYGAGSGSGAGAGGGGLGAGGAIFVQAGGSLNFAYGSLSGNYVAGGPGGMNYDSGHSAQSGKALGSGIFFQTSATSQSGVTLAPAARYTLTIDNVITGGGSGAGTVTVAGAGVVLMDVASPSTIIIEAGATLEETGDLSNSGALSVGGTLILAEQTNGNVSAVLSGAPDIGDGFADVVEKTGAATLTWTTPFALLGEFDVAAGTIGLATGTTELYGLSYTGNLIGDLQGSGGVALQAGATLALGFIGNGTAEASIGTTDFSGNITGDGTIIVQGAGTQTLSGSSAGSWIVDAGSALLLNGTGSQFANDISDNGVLLVASAGTMDLGALSGAGTLVAGSGVAALTADVSGFTGSIIDQAEVAFDPSGSTSFNGAMSGGGSVAVDGAGTLTLDESLPIGGGVTVQAGTLVLGGAIGTLGTGITDNATLVFDETDNASEAQTIAGNGTIVQAGNATLTLTGQESWQGVLVVNGGALELVPSVALHVTDLIGSGGTILLNGGTLFAAAIDPGFNDSILGPGALAVGDNATFNNRKTIPGVVFGNNDTLVNAQGTVGISAAALLGGDLVAGSGAVVQNGGTIGGAVNVASGSITNLQGGGTLSTGVIQNGVSASGQLSLTNGGMIGGAVTAGANSNVAVTSSTGSIGGGVYLNGANGSVSNAGTINGPVSVEQSATVAILAGINAGAGIVDGNVVAGTGLVLSNGGVIAGSVSMLNGNVANLHDGTSHGVSGNNSATAGFIESGVTSAGALTLTNGGTIYGGVSLGSGSIINQGGTYNYFRTSPIPPALIAYDSTRSSAGQIFGGVTAAAALTLTNYGTIAGLVALGSGTITNVYGWYDSSPEMSRGYRKAAVIENGISASSSLTLSNSGTLRGGVTLGSGTITNIGTALFGGAYPSYFGGGVTASGALYLTNGGTLFGGVTAGGRATVANAGIFGQRATIAGGIVLQGAASTFTNNGVALDGLTLSSGGTVSNLVAGVLASVTVDGAGQIYNADTIGTVWVGGGATLVNGVYNFGTIDTVTVAAGGALFNRVSQGAINDLYVFGTATNAGIIRNIVSVAAGGVFYDQGFSADPSYIVDRGTVVNAGALRNGISIGSGGTLINQAGGRLYSVADAGTAINYGLLQNGADVQAGGVLINKVAYGPPAGVIVDNGSIANYGVLNGIQVGGGGTLTNAAGGRVPVASSSDGLVVNSGYFYQLSLGGGTATNQANGTFGSVVLTSPNATLIEAGTIMHGIFVDGFATGIEIDGGGVLQIQPGAVLQEPPGAHAVYLKSGSLTLASGSTLPDVDAKENTGIVLLSGTATIGGVHGVSVVTLGAGAVLSAADFSYNGSSSVAFRGAGTLTGGAILADNIYNAATIDNAVTPQDGLSNGVLTNAAGGVINGSVVVAHLTNYGYIASATAQGVNKSGGTIGSLNAYPNGSFTNSGLVSHGVGGGFLTFTNVGTVLGGVNNYDGLLDNKGSIGGGISGDGRTIVNEAGAVISGNVQMKGFIGDQTLTNAGTIVGNVVSTGQAIGYSAATVANTGTIEGTVQGVKILSNAANGVITGGISDGPVPLYTATNAGFIGGSATLNGGDLLVNQTGGTLGTVLLEGAYATLVQAGTILGGVTLSGNKDHVVLSPTAVTYSALVGSNNDSATLELQAGYGTLNGVANFGTIIFDAGANWVIGAGVTFTAHPLLGVPGTLIGTASLDVVGLLSNYQTLTQTITVQSAATLTNDASGRLLGGVNDSGLVTNAGYISALNLTGSGVTNFSGGTIAGALIEADANDTVSNAGTVLGGITLSGSAAALTNTGRITGAVYVGGPAETVTNGGSIAGGVTITGSGDELVLSPGANFGAPVVGNASATLALAAGSGTLNGLGNGISGFGTYTAAAGAAWSLAGSTSIAGTFALGGPGSLSVTGSLDNTGTLSGNIDVAAGGTVFHHAGAFIENGLTDAGVLIDAGVIAGGVSVASGGSFSLAATGDVASVSGNGTGISVALAGSVTSGVTLQGTGNTLALIGGYTVGGSTLAAATTIELTAGGGTLVGGVSLLGHGVQLDGDAAWQDDESGSTTGGMNVSGSGSLTLNGDVTLGSGVTVGAGVTLIDLRTETGSVHAAPGAATIVDAGTMVGGITLAGGGDVLALAPGAVFQGGVSAGSGAILELRAGAGTLHSLYGFTTIAADAGANWTLIGIPALSSGLTLIGSGTINSVVLSGSGSLNNSATLNASLNVGAVENYGVILGTITSAGPIDNRGSIGASVTLTGSGGLYNHLDESVGGAVYATGGGETITNWGVITGAVSLSGHGDTVELIGAGTYAGGVFLGGVTGASDGSSTLYIPGQNLILYNLTLANLGNYTNVPNISVASGNTLTVQTLDRNETFTGSGVLSVPSIVAGTLTNAGYLHYGIVLSGTGGLVNLPGATLAGYVASGPYGGPAIKNYTAGNQTITNLGAMGGVSLGAGGVLALGPTGSFTQNVYGYHTGPGFYLGGAYNSTLRLLAGSGGISDFGDSQFDRYGPVYAFNNFNTIDVASGGTWSLSGTPKIANALLISGGGTLNLPQGLVIENGLYRNFNNVVDFEPQYFEQGGLTVSGMLTNAGVLQGNVALSGTGGFINLAGGNLNGAISVTGPGQTVGNLGAMAGGVALYGGDRLIVGAAATFGGAAFGDAIASGAISGGSGNNVLEIASGPFALTNFNAPGYAQFSALRIDAGVSVTQDASDTLTGVALVNYGTIDLSAGFTAQSTLVNGGMLTGDVTLASGVPVTNVSGGTISGNGLAVIEGSGLAAVFNAGVIDPATYGVYLPAGGYVTNASGGTIVGTAIGVKISGATGSVNNAGSIAGTGAGSTGVELISGGSVTNQSGGTIDGTLYGVQSSNAATITNDGRIGVGAVVGVGLASGLIANAATATIGGSSSGIRIFGGGTVIDAGTISGGGDAVHFYAGSVSRLVLDPGAVLSGAADGGNAVGAAIVSTLELASATAVGTLSGIGGQYVDFGAITIDGGAIWTLTGSNSLAAGGTLGNAGSLILSDATLTESGMLLNDGGIVLDPSTMFVASLLGTGAITLAAGATLEVGGTIASGETIVFAGNGAVLELDNPGSVAGSIIGFVQSDTIDLTAVAPGSVNYTPDMLGFTLSGGGDHDIPLTLGTGTILQPAAPDGSGGADLTALCFVAGTLIGTPRGEVPVENLAVGDMVNTWSGGIRPIAWIGVGKVLATRGRRGPATPAIVCKGALADNVPARALHVTKGHALLVDGVLIPVEFLVNHRSILWDDRAQEVSLYHVELDAHDVMVANGAPAESYRDDGNRWLFRNANSGWGQPAKAVCMPVLTGGPIVDAAWTRLLERAGCPGTLPLTGDSDLHLVADGMRVIAASRHGMAHVFALPRVPRRAVIASRAASPAELGIARDPRILGVAVRQIALRQGTRFRVVGAADGRLTSGFHAYESEGKLRWTDGGAELPAEMFAGFDGALELVLHVGGVASYIADAETCAA
ncbi:MAG TPA: Hint domain-containing protein [Acetobacteraceae bacterium]|jgi:hypothetical protein